MALLKAGRLILIDTPIGQLAALRRKATAERTHFIGRKHELHLKKKEKDLERIVLEFR